MIQQDYFIRVIREFFEALARAMSKPTPEDKSKAVHSRYEQYLGSYEFYQNATAEDAVSHIASIYPEDQHLQRLEMLAELYYAEADLRVTPIGQTLMERALQLFSHIDSHSNTYSITRMQKIDAIRHRLGLLSGNTI